MARPRKNKNEPKYKSEKSRKRVIRKRSTYNPIYSLRGRSSPGYAYIPTQGLPETVKSPIEFSIIKNVEETLEFFKELHAKLQKRKNIFLDMSSIKYISDDAILYLLSRLHFYSIKYPNYVIGGSFPLDPVCKDLLFDSNFTKYVITQSTHKPNKEQIFPIRDGFSASGHIIGEVLDFVESKIKMKPTNSFDIYGPMLECLANSIHHAYRVPQPIFNKWWLIAIPDNKKKIVHYTSLDNGRGIPSTVRKNFSERFSVGGKTDTELITSALMGEFRTRTKRKERGKGLPNIFEATNNSQIDNLTIISNFGYIVTQSSKRFKKQLNLDEKFHGTLISWDFKE